MIARLPACWSATNWDWFDPVHAHRIFWRTGTNRPDLDPDGGPPDSELSEIAYDLRDDAALVDTFLHHRARLHRRRVPRFRGICRAPPRGFQPAVNALPENDIWSVMERIQTLNGCHFFTACRPERLKSSYEVDFSAPEALDYVPLMRMRCGVDGDEAFWPAGLGKLRPQRVPVAVAPRSRRGGPRFGQGCCRDARLGCQAPAAPTVQLTHLTSVTLTRVLSLRDERVSTA